MNSVQMQRAHGAAPTSEIEGTLFETLTTKLPIRFNAEQCAGTVFSGLSIELRTVHGDTVPLHISCDGYQKLLAVLESICYQIPAELRGADFCVTFTKRSSDPATGAPISPSKPDEDAAE